MYKIQTGGAGEDRIRQSIQNKGWKKQTRTSVSA